MDLSKEIRDAVMAASDLDTRQKVSRLVPGAKVLGVPVPKLRQLAKIFRGQHADLSLADACKLMDELCDEKYREEILFGIFLLGGYGRKVSGLKWDQLAKWMDALDNWETCDQLASLVSGPLVAAHPQNVDNLVELTQASSLWKRRFAAATVSTINHKGRSFPAETFRVCLPLLSDLEPMVRKAVAWAIREISRKEESKAYTFLLDNRSLMPAGLLREASQKLTPEHRQELLGR